NTDGAGTHVHSFGNGVVQFSGVRVHSPAAIADWHSDVETVPPEISSPTLLGPSKDPDRATRTESGFYGDHPEVTSDGEPSKGGRGRIPCEIGNCVWMPPFRRPMLTTMTAYKGDAGKVT
ncbi:MAG: hypothetical protein ACPG1Z_09070, partial [Planctomycetota bacterium]